MPLAAQVSAVDAVDALDGALDVVAEARLVLQQVDEQDGEHGPTL